MADDLIKLERFAEGAHARLAGFDGEEYTAQSCRRDAAEAFQAAVTAPAEASSQARHEVEQAPASAVGAGWSVVTRDVILFKALPRAR